MKIALALPAGAPVTVENDAIEILSVATDKTINDLSKYQSFIALFLFFVLFLSSFL